jgi:hypothetical protein
MCKGFESKVLPRGKFIKEKLKSGSSFTWQSIMAGVENFKTWMHLESRRWDKNKYMERLVYSN